ncbi:lymphocyte-specific helicase-like [Physella acuta]|uniref:lymphocyte-specific helicase-like n=1 Tax=Physella acuta TaxID=109671 RepID=UPI0027DBAFF8|nr:lymphocyte-specific helicase-like [Physella acuta]XP_059141218.1 lymphocyte-specific helicase-like [Physella acuta]
MSTVYSTTTASENGSPSKPENMCASNIPEEEALCLTFGDGSISGGRCESPSISSSISNEESIDSFPVDPSKIITEEMLEEEKRLYSSAIKEEEKRKEEEAMLLREMTDQSKEQKFERLKFLLSKSTMYTEYLVERIKKQKEEEEKRRARLQKKNLKRKQDKEAKQSVGEDHQNVGKQIGSDNEVGKKRPARQRNKRKQSDEDTDNLPVKTKGKRAKTVGSPTLSPQSKSPTHENVDNKGDHSDSVKVDSGETAQKDDIPSSLNNEPGPSGEKPEEPELFEKALTFGVEEDECSKRVINGEQVPLLQPKLMDGGVLRPYQVEGYSWLKVLYENGVNGILADEMGLGKTVQCVAILAHLVYMGIPGPFLVCAPLSTIPNWFSEFQRFAPKVPTILYHGHKDARAHMSRRIRRKHEIRKGVSVQPVVITSYEIAMIDRKYLANHEWKYLIVDEGHRIKNTHCRLIRELRLYRSTHRLLLTGTPLQNNLAELWSLLNFLLPEIFDDLGSFETWFDINCISDASSEEKIVNQERANNILSMLHQILSPFMLRRLKSDVDLNIPPKKEIIVYAPLTQQQKSFYSALVDRTIFNLLDSKDKEEEKVETTPSGRPKRKSTSVVVDYKMMMETEEEKKLNKKEGSKACSVKRWKDWEEEEKEIESWIHTFSEKDKSNNRADKVEKQRTSQVTIKMRNVMMQLRKCCNHPYLLEHPLDPKTGDLALTEGVVTSSGKMLVLDRMLKELKKRGHRVLIFSQMTKMLDLIEDFCQIRGYDFCRLDGSTQMNDRKDSMNVFNETKDKFLFLLSTRAGGLGINLTAADTVIIYDSDWNPQCDLQAQDRCHRIGQTKPVVVYRFVTANTIDQKIIERAAAKRKLEKMIIHKGKFKSGNFTTKAKPITPEELRSLLNSKDHELEIKGDNYVITQAELDLLLDRSDLLEKWKKSTDKLKETQATPLPEEAKPKKAPQAKKGKGKKGKQADPDSQSQAAKLFKVIDTTVDEQSNAESVDMEDVLSACSQLS